MFFVASRGHHADIGGITPGSMPPHSKSIFEEGAVFKSFFLVKNGVFQEQGERKSSTDVKILLTHVIMQSRSGGSSGCHFSSTCNRISAFAIANVAYVLKL